VSQDPLNFPRLLGKKIEELTREDLAKFHILPVDTEKHREYQKSLAVLETQNRELKEADQKNKFQNFLETNPNFLKEVRKTAAGNFNLSDEMLKKIYLSV
jgi:hypothetical protein